jgi:hypothetical protein
MAKHRQERELGVSTDEIAGEDGQPNEAFVRARLRQLQLERDASQRSN